MLGTLEGPKGEPLPTLTDQGTVRSDASPWAQQLQEDIESVRAFEEGAIFVDMLGGSSLGSEY